MIIYNLNLPIFSNLAETRSPEDYNSILYHFSLDATLSDFLAAVKESEFSLEVTSL